jgi:hypothetical protein
LRGAVLAVVGVALAVGAVFFVVTSRDDSQVAGPRGPGELQPNRGASHAARAEPAGGDPPTSGAHRPDLVTRDRRPISDDQLIHALELGDVVILYEGREPPADVVRLQEEVAGAFDAELAAAGQAVILARRAGAGAATALAWRRLLRVDDAADPALREFTEYWLGRGLQP